jgi:GNAT superfamily N-acetyltransferase
MHSRTSSSSRPCGTEADAVRSIPAGLGRESRGMENNAEPSVPWRVRPARAADNDALCRLAARCPMAGGVSICVHREPDFFALDAMLGNPWHVLVAEVAGAVVGCVAWAIRDAYVNGTPVRTGYIGDLKVDPAFRRRGLGGALARAVRSELDRVDPALPTLFTSLTGNRPVASLPGVKAEDHVSRRIGVVRVHSIPLLSRRRLSTSGGYVVREAQWDDLEQMAACWAVTGATRQFTRVVSPEMLAGAIDTAPGLEVSSYLLALDRRGTIVGFLALWDQRELKTTRILRYSRRQAVFRTGFNAVAPLFAAARLPSPGSALRGAHVFHACVPSAEVLRSLLVEGYRRFAGSGLSYMAIGLDRCDPVRRALAGLWAQPTDVEVLVATPGGEDALPCLDPKPVHYETALV